MFYGVKLMQNSQGGGAARKRRLHSVQPKVAGS
jgi:hypothetical protein